MTKRQKRDRSDVVDQNVLDAFAQYPAVLRLVDAIQDGEVPPGEDAVVAWLRAAPDGWVVSTNKLLRDLAGDEVPPPDDDPDAPLAPGAAGLMIASLLVGCEGHEELVDDDAFMAECIGKLRLLVLYEMGHRAGAFEYAARGPLLCGSDFGEALKIERTMTDKPDKVINAWISRVLSNN
jgi:hypothetical protein